MVAMRRVPTIAGLFLATALGAQQPEPATLGLQLRGSLPLAGLSDAVGGNSPGVGFSVVMEQDLVEHFEGWHARVDFGADSWFWSNVTKTPGAAGKVQAGHLMGEAVRMLRPGGDPVSMGPYMTLGLGLYAWDWSHTDPVLGKLDTKVIHGAGTFGFGWRYTKSLDFEAKLLAGKLAPATTAAALLVAATWRF